MEKKQATTGDLTKETASDNDASASHKRKREATADDDILLDLDTDKMVDDDIFPDLDTDKMVDDDILPDLDADKMVDDDILPDLDANNMEDLDKIVELDKIKILDLMHHHSWATSPESGAYAMGAWGPGLWSSSSASMPFTGRYIDTWCRGYSEDDCFLCVTGEHGVTFKKADEAIIHASIQPGSTMILESKYNVMVFGRSPSSLLFCMNSGEDLRAFGKRTHWSVANVGAEFTSQEYFEKMKVQIKYAEFMGLEEEKNATEAFYVPFSAYNMDRYPDLQNAGLIQDFDNFRDLVLPGLWEDIYDTYKGRRSVELSNVISALVQSMVKKIDVTKLSGGQASLPTGITWWLNMDRERRDDMTAFYF